MANTVNLANVLLSLSDAIDLASSSISQHQLRTAYIACELGKQAELFPSWRYHAFLTDREGTVVFLDADHRRHAVVELAIRDLKEGAGMTHCPSGNFNANAAWAVLATVAHNMVRWLASLGLDYEGPVVAKTIRRKFITVPGRLTHRSRRAYLHLPTQWPWATEWSACFDRLKALSLRT